MLARADTRLVPITQPAQVATRFDEQTGAYWALMAPKPRPCFSVQLLDDLQAYIRTITDSCGTLLVHGREHRIQYGVLASNRPNVFNLGGDLALFRMLIQQQDRRALLDYGRKCIDNLFTWHQNCDGLITSIALVQGDALGGGFEAALSASVLIAEESSRFGFPEILFNLFPGMGAFSFLSRRIGRKAAEEIIMSGTIYPARQLYDLGVIDVLTPDGTGEAAVQSFIRKHARNVVGRQGFERARNEVLPITREELTRVVEIWADTALKLQERDLKVMDRLIRAQARTVEADESSLPSNVLPIYAAGGDSA